MAIHDRITIGEKFTRLTVIEKLPYSPGSVVYFICKCDCGKIRKVSCYSLADGDSKSCGCLSRDRIILQSTKHGAANRKKKTLEYHIWVQMIGRCNNEKNKGYRLYGGRGVKVCERWLRYENFIADMGRKPSGRYSLDRKDNDGNYEPDNCHWATDIEQARNKRMNRNIEFNGVTQCLSAWAASLKINTASLAERISKWPLERALTESKDARFCK